MQKIELYKVLFALVDENKKLNYQINEAIQYIEKINTSADGYEEKTSKTELTWIYQNILLRKIGGCINGEYVNILKPKIKDERANWEKVQTLTDEHLKLLGYEVDREKFIEKTAAISNNDYFRFLDQTNSMINKCQVKNSLEVGKNKGIHIEDYSDLAFGKYSNNTNVIEQWIALFRMNYDTLYLNSIVNSFKSYESFLNYLISIENLPTYWQEKIIENSELRLEFDFEPIIDKSIDKLVVEKSSSEYFLIKRHK